MVSEEIWKFPISLETLSATSEPIVELPTGARVISAQAQGNDLCLWAIVDPTQEKRARQFSIYGTGHPVIGFSHPIIKERNFIGTVQFYDGTLVLHVFENKGW